MIVVASGHAGVEQYCRQMSPANVVSAASWAEVLTRWSQVERVLLGQNLQGFSDALDWLKRTDLEGRHCVLWVGHDFQHPLFQSAIPGLDIWRGEIDQNHLSQWWQSESSLEPLPMGKSWLLFSLFPYRPINPIVTFLTKWADARYGTGGGWVDLDFKSAQLSLEWCPDLHRQSRYRFEQFRPHMVKGHPLIPAPPPWMPALVLPDARGIERMVRQQWPWQGWYLGPELMNVYTVDLVQRIPWVVLWVDAATPEWLVERTVEFIRLYRQDAQWLIAAPEPLAYRDRSRANKWCFVALSSAATLPPAPGRRGFHILPRKKG